MKTTLTLSKDKRDEHRAKIQATNGKVIFASTEGYKNRIDCIQNLKDVENALKFVNQELDQPSEQNHVNIVNL